MGMFDEVEDDRELTVSQVRLLETSEDPEDRERAARVHRRFAEAFPEIQLLNEETRAKLAGLTMIPESTRAKWASIADATNKNAAMSLRLSARSQDVADRLRELPEPDADTTLEIQSAADNAEIADANAHQAAEVARLLNELVNETSAQGKDDDVRFRRTHRLAMLALFTSAGLAVVQVFLGVVALRDDPPIVNVPAPIVNVAPPVVTVAVPPASTPATAGVPGP